MFYHYTLWYALSVDDHLKPLLKLLILLHLSLQRLKRKKKKPHLGREQCNEALPEFIRTIDNHSSNLGLQLISYKYTAPKVPGQGKSFFGKAQEQTPKAES